MEQNSEHIVKSVIEEEMKRSFLEYAMSVIVARALPDARDGLKPVHRRILFAMNEIGLQHSKSFKKCARIVGEVLGKYHPHGDSAVYESLVRMAQNWSLRYPLVSGQGNFGSIDGDSAAAMRYTEAKLAKIADEMLADIDKETVDFQPNFDGTLDEPTLLPTVLPNLLINGSSGIAVGMATNIPPHNLTEVCDAAIAVIKQPDISIKELIAIVKAPDYPTGGILMGIGGILQAYSTGRGKVKIRARITLEEKQGRERLIVTEIPYMINKSSLLEEIAEQVKNKVVEGISGLRDESDKDGMRIVIELKRDASSDIVMNQLYKHTKLESIQGIRFLALVDNIPRFLDLKQALEAHIQHRVVVVTRRTQFELKKAEARLHVLEGLLIALGSIDEIIRKIKASASVEEARAVLCADYTLSEIQSNAILDMKLQKLASLEQAKIRQEHQEITDLIVNLRRILSDKQEVLSMIVEELETLKTKYSDKRRTDIVEIDEDLDMEDLIQEEDMIITISHSGYIKRLPLSSYKQQYRGGKGVIGAETKEEDFIERIFIANTHSYLLIFTDKGNVHWLKVYRIPEAGRYSKGKAIVNLLHGLREGEKISAVIPIKEFDDQHFMMFATKKGIVKKTNLMHYSRPRTSGIIAISLDEGDDLIDVILTDGSKQIIIASSVGQAVRFNETDVRTMGRDSRGVIGMRLHGDDVVVGMIIAEEDKTLLTLTENGFGKRTMTSEYRLINRGGTGVINIQTSERNGKVVAVMSVTDEDEIILISQEGMVMRTACKFISIIGRNTQGVRLMKLNAGDRLMDVAKVINNQVN